MPFRIDASGHCGGCPRPEYSWIGKLLLEDKDAKVKSVSRGGEGKREFGSRAPRLRLLETSFPRQTKLGPGSRRQSAALLKFHLPVLLLDQTGRVDGLKIPDTVCSDSEKKARVDGLSWRRDGWFGQEVLELFRKVGL